MMSSCSISQNGGVLTEDSSGSVIASETGLAHTGAVVDVVSLSLLQVRHAHPSGVAGGVIEALDGGNEGRRRKG